MPKVEINDILGVALETVEERVPNPPDAKWFLAKAESLAQKRTANSDPAIAVAPAPPRNLPSVEKSPGVFKELSAGLQTIGEAIEELIKLPTPKRTKGPLTALHLVPAIAISGSTNARPVIPVVGKSGEGRDLTLTLTFTDKTGIKNLAPPGSSVEVTLVSYPAGAPISSAQVWVEEAKREYQLTFTIPEDFAEEARQFITAPLGADSPIRFLLEIEPGGTSTSDESSGNLPGTAASPGTGIHMQL